jgi:hypothetical protein
VFQEFLHYASDSFDICTKHDREKFDIFWLSHTSPIFYANEESIYEAHYVDQVSVDLEDPTAKITAEHPFSLAIHVM